MEIQKFLPILTSSSSTERGTIEILSISFDDNILAGKHLLGVEKPDRRTRSSKSASTS